MKFNKTKNPNNNQQNLKNDMLKKTNNGNLDTGPNSVLGPIKNYDDDFLRAHATKPDDVILEELTFYVNYKKQRGDFISYDEKVQIDRYCNLLFKQLKVNRLWREEKGVTNVGGFNNIPKEFYDIVENNQLPFVNLYYKDNSINTFSEVSIRIPNDKIEEFKKLKYANPDLDFKGKNSKVGSNVLFTIDVDVAQQNNSSENAFVNKYAGMSEKEIKKLKKQEAKELKKANKNSSQQSTTSTSSAPSIPNRPSVPGANSAPSIPGAPNIQKSPHAPQVKPKGMFDL